ncbi:malto-oligosyltrehalose synthase [Haliangium sp.]|uniref:malto-oligosyltrehalose synthase n=1 Tax=Haliangium sp. TaxID=2663208 RepID=UPI003D0FA1E8
MNATYRLQLGPDFGFAEVRALIPYLRRLGISHLYLSPITEARQGSTHGYDVTDHNRIRDALGGEPELEALREAAVAAGLALIIDIVPNHAGVGPDNSAWQDLLAYGPHSPSTALFDVDWSPIKIELDQKLLLPFLGQTYGAALDGGEIVLVYDRGRLHAGYFDHRFALRPESYAEVLAELLPRIERTDAYWTAKELHEAYDSVSAEERDRAEALHERFSALAEATPGELADALAVFAGERLHQLLERQFWRLSYYKTAGYEINYRRFFDINELVALRMEVPEAFFAAHRKIGQLLLQEGIYGVRVDHVDGLADPHGYLARLREIGAGHVWVEKIVAPGEILPEGWPVEGTTGYEFANDVVRLLCWPDGQVVLDRGFRNHVGSDSYEDQVHEGKHLVMATNLAGELFRLAYSLDRLSEADYHTRDFTLEALREALAQVVAAFSRYRTYLPYDLDQAEPVVKAAIHEAKRRSAAFEPTVYDFLEAVLLGRIDPSLEQERMAWVGRFQQYCAPVAAKGVEDTAFYRYTRLLALNEVGGEPAMFFQEPHAFHAHARFRAMRYPKNLLATATHDHKRGEDTRMRLVVLSELATEWARLVRQLERARERLCTDGGPSASDAYLFYQVLIALWRSAPRAELSERLVAYMLKASREAKQDTNWLNPDEAYEAALERFVRDMLRDRWVSRAVTPLAARVARHGFANGITQLVLKLTTPGVPDFYQGAELLDLSLVDPDNRRPVDYEHRARLLGEAESLIAGPDVDAIARMVEDCDERLKLYVIARLLRFRAQIGSLFTGGYQAMAAEGEAADHVITFARECEHHLLVVIVPRYTAVLAARGGLGDTSVAVPEAGRWRELISGQRLDLAESVRVAELPLPWAVLHYER